MRPLGTPGTSLSRYPRETVTGLKQHIASSASFPQEATTMQALEPNRRALLLGLGAAALMTQSGTATARTLPALPTANIGADTTYWTAVRNLYSVTPGMVNLENGYWGIMAEPVKAEYKRLTDFVNFENTVYARTRIGKDLDDVRTPLAAFLGVAREEIALSRGATEAL
jgi:isopenicillin-N epimerase